MRYPVTKYGLREVLVATLVFGVLMATGLAYFWPAAIAPAILWVYVLAFFRDPTRTPDEPDAFLSPADGTVVDITPLPADGPLGVESLRIGIFMSLFSVHVNRCPFEATVVRLEHHPGGFVDARRPDASEVNESATLFLSARRGGREFPLATRQVAGLIARRIVTAVRPGQALQAGQRIGMIKFGSRGELIVPRELVGEVAVRIGQKVYGGKTVLIRPPADAKGTT